MLTILIVINYFFIDNFFIQINKSNIIHESAKYLDYDNDNNFRISKELTGATGGNVILINDDLPPRDKHMLGNNDEIITNAELELIENNASTNIKNGYFTVTNSEDVDGSKILYGRFLNNGNLLIIVKHLGIISEMQQTFMFFLTITTALIYIIAFLIILFFSSRITRPVVTLKDAAEKIASLNFQDPLVERGSDEIGQLIVSVNIMAKELSKNIEALNESNEQLSKELSKEKSLETMRRRFVSDVSHELKNPISIILGYADGLHRGIPKTKEDLNYYYEVILDEGKRMNQLIIDLLDLSCYQSRTFTMKKEEVEFNILIENALERHEYITNKRSIDVILNMDENCIVYGDSLRLAQVIINLTSNAFKYVNQSGQIIVNLINLSDKVKFTISNSGPLIPKNELDNIWNSFYQLDTIKNGNGLGLAIVKSIVDLHHGQVRSYIEDNMNKFEVILTSIHE